MAYPAKFASAMAGSDRLSGSVVPGALRIAMLLGLPLLISCNGKVAVKGGGADDSPVTVRGGSLTLRAPKGFNCSSKLPCSATNDPLSASDMSVLLLGKGVLLNNSPNPPSPITTNMNWVLKFTFSDGHRGEDASHFLEVCSAPGCVPNGAIVAGPLYLQADDPDDNTAAAWATSSSNPSTDESFHLTKCGGHSESGESACNHIFSVVYQSGSTSTTYSCQGGKCVIGIGHPPTAAAPK